MSFWLQVSRNFLFPLIYRWVIDYESCWLWVMLIMSHVDYESCWMNQSTIIGQSGWSISAGSSDWKWSVIFQFWATAKTDGPWIKNLTVVWLRSFPWLPSIPALHFDTNDRPIWTNAVHFHLVKSFVLTWLDNRNLKALNDDQIASFGCQSGTFYQYSVRKVFWSRVGWNYFQSEWLQMKTCSVMEMAMKEMLPLQAMATMVAIQITTCHVIRKR